MSNPYSIVQIGDVIQTKNDKSKQLQSGEYLKNGILPIVDQGAKFVCGYTNDLTKSYDKGLPVVIFGDHTLHTKYIDFNFAIGADGTQVLTSKSKDSDVKYLYYLITRAAELIGSEGYKRHFKILKEFDIEYIDALPEQQKIATILSSVDNVIEKTRAQIDKLKDLKTGMMQELLTKGIGHTEFKDSPVGRIPAGWEVKALGDVFALSSGSTPSRSVPEYYCSSLNAHSWVKTLDLSDGLIFKTDEKITDQAIQNSSCKVYPIGTALVAMYGGWNQIGRSGLLAIPAATNQAICALLSKGIVEGSYANYWLASERYRWKSIAASSRKDPNITKQDVSDFLITVPTLDEQKKIVIRLDNATELVDKKIKQLSFYTSIKKALMQDLLTGKVRVNLTDKESAVV